LAGKIITIDWQSIQAMTNDTYKLKALNNQQIAVLLALCEYQHWQTRWDNLDATQQEIDRFIGDIEFRLMGDEEGLMATEDDIRNGMYRAFNDIAKQIVSGGIGGFSVDEDGNVTIGSGAGAEDELPEDDTGTPEDETETARMGGSLEVAALFENVIEQIDFLYGAVNGTPSYTAAQAEAIMAQIWDFDAALLNAAVTNYYAYRATNPRLLYVKAASFAQYLYCNGATAQIASRYLILVIGFVFAKQDAILKFWNALAQAQIDEYFVNGISKPSTTYLEAGCVPSPREIMLLSVFNTNVQSQTSWKPNHRLKFTVTGVLTDPVGHKRDFWYYDANNAAPLFVPASMSMQLGTGITKPTINQVPFSATGSYIFTIDTPASSGVLILNMAAGGVFNAPFTGAPITVTIDDLGEISF